MGTFVRFCVIHNFRKDIKRTNNMKNLIGSPNILILTEWTPLNSIIPRAKNGKDNIIIESMSKHHLNTTLPTKMTKKMKRNRLMSEISNH